jgi:hypothetical protein
MGLVRKTAKSLLNYWPFRQVHRSLIIYPYFIPRLILGFRWTTRKTESSNFYYDLTDKNLLELEQFVSIVCGVDISEAEAYVREVRANTEIRSHIESTLLLDKTMRDSNFFLGRRIGWYAVIRAMKPKLVVETGVHQGVGAVTIISALMRNSEDGFPGRYIGTDIDPGAGELLNGKYLQYGEVLFGDSIESLENINEEVDVFINDSDHSEIYEAKEYVVIGPKLGTGAIVLGDNSHATDALLKYSKATNRRFLFFKEEPKSHWYPGAGIGASF